MHPLVPEIILENYAAGITSGTYSAVGIFVDISGFSAMTDTLMEHGQHGAEVLAEVMRAAFKPLMHSVYEQGGYVITQSGDSFNALIPLDSENSSAIHRALTAAWNIRFRATENSLFETPYGRFSITVKVGVALSETSWGIITSTDQRRAAYFFRGTAVDGSAEAEHYAAPGDVIVDPAFHQQAEKMATFESIGAHYRLVDLSLEPAPSQPFALPKFNIDYAVRFYPHDLYLQPQNGEFRRCTNLFVRLPTVRTETQLRIFMQTVFELQDQYGGLLELRFGDKGAHLLLIWGAPIAFENDIERSLNFIYELQARTTIPINAGVTNRIAHAGFIGCDVAEEYTAFGRGANLAARFMTSAPRGEIWVDENVVEDASRCFDFEYGGQQPFKGFSQPQKYFILVERKEQVDYDYEGELVGRKEEMKILRKFVNPIFSSSFSGIMLVRGDPGIGKSRLLHEFIADLKKDHPEEFQFFLAQSDEIIRQPFNPLRYWLRQYFDVRDSQSDAQNKRAFNRKIDRLLELTQNSNYAEELDRVRSFLGALVGLFWSDSLYEQLDARGRYENTIIALNILLQSESLQKPSILLLEDVHWFDEDSRTYIPALLRSMTADSEKSYPFAVFATARLEDNQLEFDDFPHAEIQLQQLDRASLASLAASQLDGIPGESLLDILIERSEGNPFFAEEMLRYLQQHNLLDCQPDGCIVISEEKAALPVSISSLLVSRLDHLLIEVKEIVQTAAVLGREFEINLLAQMLENTSDLSDQLHSAERANIWAALSGTRYIFRHTLMRDAAYTMLIMARRKQLHAMAVAALETVYQGHLNNHYGELAYHALQAGLDDRACHYYKFAGEVAQQGYQNALAVEYYSQALSLTPNDALSEQFDLIHARMFLYEQLGMIEERRKDLLQLEMLAASYENIIIVLLERANLAIDLDSYDDAYRLAQEAAALAQSNNDYNRLAKAHRYAALALFRMGKYEPAIEQSKRALDNAHQIDDPDLLSKILTNIGLIYLDQEKIDEAHETFVEALEISERSNMLWAQAANLNNLAQAKGLRGDLLQAEDYFKKSLEIARKIGSRRNEGLILGNLGWVSSNLGNYESARAYLHENLKISRQTGIRYQEVIAMINLSAASSALADYSQAARWAEQALELAHQINQPNAEAWALTYLGHARLGQNNLPQAAAAYGAAVEIRNHLDQSILAAEPTAGLAFASFAIGNVEEGLQQLQPILALLETESTLEGTDEPLRIYAICYLVLTALNDGRADRILEKGFATLQSRAAQIPDEMIRKRYLEDIPHHQQIYAAWMNKNRPLELGPV
jgi:predicted ATPase/class 3 adenylate cyclase